MQYYRYHCMQFDDHIPCTGKLAEDDYTCSISHSFIRIDRLVQLATVEEVLQQFLHLWNACRASNQHNIMYRRLVHLGVTKRLFHWLQSAAEQVGVQLLKPGTGDAGVEVDAFKERINLNVRLKPSATKCV